MNTPALDQRRITIDVDLPVDGLVSYYYFQTDEVMEEVTASRLRLIADSGAFSAYTQGARINLDEYATWLKTWSPRLYWAAALDVFGDPDASLANFRHLRDQYGLTTVPTIHIGADPRQLDTYAAEGVDFVALGGMVGMPKPNVLRWLVHVMRYARDHHPQMRFHAWGMSSHSVLEKLPLYSVDSSGLLTQAYRYGTLTLWNPHSRRTTSIPLDGHTPHQHRDLLRNTYGVPASLIDRSVPHRNKHLLVRLAAYSTQLRATHLQNRHRIPPPRWGINPNSPPLTGPRMHFVLDTTDFRRVCTPLAHGDPLK